jgi:hypothetical protein
VLLSPTNQSASEDDFNADLSGNRRFAVITQIKVVL